MLSSMILLSNIIAYFMRNGFLISKEKNKIGKILEKINYVYHQCCSFLFDSDMHSHYETEKKLQNNDIQSAPIPQSHKTTIEISDKKNFDQKKQKLKSENLNLKSKIHENEKMISYLKKMINFREKQIQEANKTIKQKSDKISSLNLKIETLQVRLDNSTDKNTMDYDFVKRIEKLLGIQQNHNNIQDRLCEILMATEKNKICKKSKKSYK
jgi:chromosome segregation ATPase